MPSLFVHSTRLGLTALLSLVLGETALADAATKPTPSSPATSEVRQKLPFLSPTLGSHMVLQRGKPNRFWGWSSPGDRVTVELGGTAVAQAQAGPDGRWLAEFKAPPAGGPYRLRVVGAETVELEDVLCGDVWVCGGQSNMNLALKEATGGREDAATAQLPGLRLFRVRQQVGYGPMPLPLAQWSTCTPAEAANFSAVAFHFGKRLQSELSIPIGLVQSAVGGSPAESWISPEGLGGFPEFGRALSEIRRLNHATTQRHGSFLMHWLEENDAGTRDANWSSPALDESDWKPVSPATAFADLGVKEAAAIAWFRLRVTLPATLPPGQAQILLGVVDKMDTVSINGQWVGASSWVENPRKYPVGSPLLQPGENLISIRVAKLGAKGGFLSGPDSLRLVLGDGTVFPLAAQAWKGRLGHLVVADDTLPLDRENYPTMPTVLQNGMLAPVAPLAVTGALWYQGEANFTRAHQYRRLLPALIADWRRLFHNDEKAPFIIIGLPAFMQRRPQPGDDAWAELRDAQALAARQVPGASLAVTIDTGDANDIHPREKRLVADRAARAALAGHYGQGIESQGPTLLSHTRRGDALVLQFAHAEGGLVARGENDTLADFAVAGADQRWHWAQASLEGDRVVLRCAEEPEPVAARYAWQANPRATLFNKAGLPAAPFRTDDWRLSTEK